jgi:enoyl-CoA hydratase
VDTARPQAERLGPVTLIRISRPEARNALSRDFLAALLQVLQDFDADPAQRCAIITGSEHIFAAGGDIKAMARRQTAELFAPGFFAAQDGLSRCRKPLIAAVAGPAFGGGCELAMLCDLIIAADNAQFSQPEITLAIGPGMGGTQRLTRLVGRMKAMDLCLTGRPMDANEAERAGLVSRVVPLERLLPEAIATAERIAALAPLAVLAIKEMVKTAEETTLEQGLAFEKRMFQLLFSLEDRKEGLAAFIEKRKPHFRGQ